MHQQYHHDQRRPQTELENMQLQKYGARPKQFPKKLVASTSGGGAKKPPKPAYQLPSIEQLEEEGIQILSVDAKEKGTNGPNIGLVETNYVRLLI